MRIIISITNRLKLLKERLNGTDFTKIETLKDLNLSAERSQYYSSSGNKHLEKVLNSLNIKPYDSIVDIGCGKGGALVTMSKYPFGFLGGIELTQKLYNIAQKNMLQLKIKNVTLHCCDASEFSDINDYNYIYFYNPFPSIVMKAVMENIINSVQAKPRKITIIYKNPVCHEDIIGTSKFVKTQEFPAEFELKFFIYENIN